MGTLRTLLKVPIDGCINITHFASMGTLRTLLKGRQRLNLYLVKFEARWILDEGAFYCFIILFIWKWILT